MATKYWTPDVFTKMTRPPAPRNLFYVVVEEIVDGTVTLVATRWPKLDDKGRRDFGDESDDQVFSLELARAQQFLNQRTAMAAVPVPEEAEPVTLRPLRLGDAFALTGAGLGSLKAMRRRATFPRARVIDVTRAARHAAKVAFSRAVGTRFVGSEPPAAPERPAKAKGGKRS